MTDISQWVLEGDGWEVEFDRFFDRFGGSQYRQTGVRRKWFEDLGGWMYRFPSGIGPPQVVFGPSLVTWTDRIATAMATVIGTTRAISFELDLEHATSVPQDPAPTET